MTHCKESVFQAQQGWCTYELTETVAVATRLSQVLTRKNVMTDKGSGHKIPHLTKKLLVIDTCWEREKQFSPMEFHWVYQLLFVKQNPKCLPGSGGACL